MVKTKLADRVKMVNAFSIIVSQGITNGFDNIDNFDVFADTLGATGVFLKVFDTSQFCKFGIYLGEYNGECFEFHPNQLSLENKDCNNDGFADITFKGEVRNTCLSIKVDNAFIQLEITFYYNPAHKKWELSNANSYKLFDN